MTVPRRARKIGVFVVAFAAGIWVCDRLMTSHLHADDAPAATQPAATQPAATRPALPADVQAVADRMKKAYGTFPLHLRGTLSSDFDVAGMGERKSLSFHAALKSPTVFRHELVDEAMIVGDGEKLHLYAMKPKQFVSRVADVADGRMKPDASVSAILADQNPALLVAVTGDAERVLTAGGTAPRLLEPAVEGGRTFDRVRSTHEDVTSEVWVDQASGRIDRVEIDLAAYVTKQGATQVKQARVTLRYDAAQADVKPLEDAMFVFAPPPEAREAMAPSPGEMLGGGEAKELEGKPAPAFTLRDLDGKEVTLEAARGSVVVLDFWATWCGPCREGLPHLAEAAKKYAGSGVKVYAVNVQEDAGTVRKYLTDERLALTALLDADGAVGKSYGVTGIPQTVVIGRDGVVRHVMIGFSSGGATELSTQIDAALK